MPREFRQCWAHSPQGHRCTLRAGHPADHVHKITWPDTEATPAQPMTHTSVAAVAAQIATPSEPVKTDPGKCVACHHKHRGRECPGACECKEFIG